VVLALKATVASVAQEAAERVAAVQAEADARILALAAKADTTALDAKVSLLLIDAKGDLLVGSAPDVAGRLGVGADGQVLTADAAQTLGARWASPAASDSSSLVTLAPSTSARNVVQPAGAAVVPITAKGAAGQTSSLQEWQNSGGAVPLSVSAGGALVVSPGNGILGVLIAGGATLRMSNAAASANWFWQVLADKRMNFASPQGEPLIVSNPLQVTGSVFATGGLGINGNAPVGKAAAIASPASDTSGTKAAIDAIRVALTNIGITA
jgi:hypothetical protein